MLVHELIARLQTFDPNMEVLVESDSGEPWPCFGAKPDVWVNDDGSKTPVALIQADF
jgi:hypothetical protein